MSAIKRAIEDVLYLASEGETVVRIAFIMNLSVDDVNYIIDEYGVEYAI
jgi:hypothetical protein